MSDPPILQEAAVKDLPEYVPGYGIAVRGGGSVQFEVNIEAEDTPLLEEGQSAVAYVLPDRRPIPSRVSRVLRHVSEETGQSIAWVTPDGAAAVEPNEFIYVNILARTRRRVLSVPTAAVLARDGKLFVLKAAANEKAEAALEPVEVSTGLESGSDVEIRSGLAPGDRVAIQGGVGYLYPGFKSQGED